MANLHVIPVKAVTIMSYNARSFFYKKDLCRSLIEASDVFVVVESWLTPRLPNSMLSIKSYNIARLDRHPTIRKRGGGIIIYIKDCFLI